MVLWVHMEPWGSHRRTQDTAVRGACTAPGLKSVGRETNPFEITCFPIVNLFALLCLESNVHVRWTSMRPKGWNPSRQFLIL